MIIYVINRHLHCTVYSVQGVHCVHCTLYTSQCIQCILQMTTTDVCIRPGRYKLLVDC